MRLGHTAVAAAVEAYRASPTPNVIIIESEARGDTPSYAGRRSVVLDKHRKGESTATQYPDAEKGKISDVGK